MECVSLVFFHSSVSPERRFSEEFRHFREYVRLGKVQTRPQLAQAARTRREMLVHCSFLLFSSLPVFPARPSTRSRTFETEARPDTATERPFALGLSPRPSTSESNRRGENGLKVKGSLTAHGRRATAK
jgi:hypothetical protein